MGPALLVEFQTSLLADDIGRIREGVDIDLTNRHLDGAVGDLFPCGMVVAQIFDRIHEFFLIDRFFSTFIQMDLLQGRHVECRVASEGLR